MRNPGGYSILTTERPTTVNYNHLRCEVVGEGTHEADVYVCAHDNRVIQVPPGAVPEELGSMCRMCMKMVCPWCAQGPCVPWLKQLEMSERRDAALRSYGML